MSELPEVQTCGGRCKKKTHEVKSWTKNIKVVRADVGFLGALDLNIDPYQAWYQLAIRGDALRKFDGNPYTR
ncbi:Hypothetical protein Cul210931_0738 [Corynebacterium ulcerans]|uniref:Transposase n=1 Tax=Corynebacterium ulcerans FRC58 TaxID=1408268 RepID=A0ABN4GSP4_CORUL|nr:Hypothetical protein Cul210931_0738 [Corynebacterium ulcerans]AKN76668.1 Hypothetical protein CulFRC58_0814 [Corynebacterium ulcerans FRC58]